MVINRLSNGISVPGPLSCTVPLHSLAKGTLSCQGTLGQSSVDSDAGEQVLYFSNQQILLALQFLDAAE